MIRGLCIRVDHLNAKYDAMNLPPCVDRAPFNLSPTGRRLWRTVGASKKGSLTFFKPYKLSMCGHQLPFHDYLVSYLTGNKVDVTEVFQIADIRPTSRARTALTDVAYPVRVQLTPLVRAAYLESISDGSLQRMANAELERRHIDCDYGNSRVEGNSIYYDCGPQGRKCMEGSRHERNRFYVEFEKSGDMVRHCYSESCPKPKRFGQCVSDVRRLVDADVWGPTSKINPYLIGTLLQLALEASTEGKVRETKIKQMPNTPWAN